MWKDMPDLLKLCSLAKQQPDSYRVDVLSQYNVFQARVELYKMQPGQEDEELVQIIDFLTQLCPFYKNDLKQFAQTLLALLLDGQQQMPPGLRMSIFKNVARLFNKQVIQFDQQTLTSLFSLLTLHDKLLRQEVQGLILRQLPHYLRDNQILNPFVNVCLSDSASVLLKQKLLEVLHELFYQNRLKNDIQSRKIVNLFADLLVQTPDRRIIVVCLNFLLNEDKEDDENDEEQIVVGNDGDITVADAIKQDEINKLYNQLRQTVRAFKLDEVRRRKEIEKIQQKIRRLRYKNDTKISKQLNCLDYIRAPLRLVEQLVSKFLSKSCQMVIRMRVFELIAKITQLYQLQTVGIFDHFSKYLRPSQTDVTQILEYMIQCVNINQALDELKQVVNTIFLNFVSANSSDDEMTVGISSITEICKRNPACLLEDDDGVNLLNLLLSYSRDKQVLGSHQKTQSNTKTSSATRKGVTMASRHLMNFYRHVAPGYLERRYLDRDSSMLLQNLKKINQNTKFIVNTAIGAQPITRLPNIEILEGKDGEPSEESSEHEAEVISKHQRRKNIEQRKKLLRRIADCQKTGRTLFENEIALIRKIFGWKVDEFGAVIAKEEAPDTWEQLEGEEEHEDTEELSEASLMEHEDDTTREHAFPDARNYCEEVYESDEDSKDAPHVYDPTIPLEQQKVLSQEEIMLLRQHKRKDTMEIDLTQFVRKKKMTAEEKRQHNMASKDPDAHRSNYWNRKDITRKSRTNKEKAVLKPIAMTLHSQIVRQRAGRSRREKERVRRQHAYNSKRGIDKKINKF